VIKINISLFFNIENESSVSHVRKIVKLSQYVSFVKLFMHKDLEKEFSPSNIVFNDSVEEAIKNSDMAIVVGGDGTILKYAKSGCRNDIPILGINNGKLGFIAGIESNEIENIFMKLISKKYYIDSRMLISAEISNEQEYCALNDIVLIKGSDSQVINYSISQNNNNICHYYADGIIISTPTGSTAYSLSAGGPIVDSSLECFVITPICAHSLTARPLILDTAQSVKIDYDIRKKSGISIIADGQKILNSCVSGSVIIKKFSKSVNFIVFKDNYRNIDKKLIYKALY
jgi:NAD+ kinase